MRGLLCSARPARSRRHFSGGYKHARRPVRHPGDDSLTAGTEATIIEGIGGNATLTGSNFADLIFGDEGNDSIAGLDGNDLLDGGTGNDNINTGAGDDLVRAGGGDDTVGGMAGNDTVFAGAGDDLVAWNDPVGDLAFGDAGNDTMSGGGGNNSFEYNGDVVVGQDLITDFNILGDVIRLSNFEPDFNPLDALTDGPIGAVLDLGGGDNVTFLGRLAREFDASDFVLV